MKWKYSSVIVTLHVTCRLQGYARVYDQSENKEIGGRGAKLGGGPKLLVGGHAPPPAGYGPGYVIAHTVYRIIDR